MRDYPRYPSRSSIITKVFKSRELFLAELERAVMMEEGLDGCDLADSEHREGESKVPECRQPPEVRKSKEADSPLQPEKNTALPAPWL